MLTEVQLLLVSFAMLLLSLLVGIIARDTARKTNKNADGGPSPNKPQVVTLGYIQMIWTFGQFILTPNIPNYEVSARVSKLFGDVVVMIRHPLKRQVILNVTDISVAKSVMSSCSNRLPSDHYLHHLLDGKPVGFFFGDGGYAKEGRKTVIKLLQRFGFYREETMEKIIQVEMRELLDKEFFGKIQPGQKTAVLSTHHVFHVYALNVVHQVVLGSRLEAGDPAVQRLQSVINNFNDSLNTSVLDLFPWLRHVPFLRFRRKLVEFNRFFKEYFQKELLEPSGRSGSYRSNPVNFKDYLLLEMDRKMGDNPCYLSGLNVTACVRDLFTAGMETTNSTLEFGILYVCLQPEIQWKVQGEIDGVIGRTREPRFQDRKRMPYTQAVLLEILRYSTPATIVTRCPLKDEAIMKGHYEIPKDSLVAINLYAIHRNTQIWTDPDEFRPERFLNENNELINLDKIMPFGYGPRACFGKFVGEMSLFIFFVSLLQKFTFELSQAHGPPCMKNRMGLSRGPAPYYVQVSKRRSTTRKLGEEESTTAPKNCQPA